jgi:hypothetical protein
MQVDVGNGSVWLVPDYTPSSESTKTLDSPERLVYTPGRRGKGVGDAAHRVAPYSPELNVGLVGTPDSASRYTWSYPGLDLF